jgi:hypothetical protein
VTLSAPILLFLDILGCKILKNVKGAPKGSEDKQWEYHLADLQRQ